MAAAWLAAGPQDAGGSVLGRVLLVAVAVLAVSAFAILQARARPRPRRPDWRYGYPPGYEPYPLYDPARSPWVVRDEAAREADPPPLPGPALRA